MEQQKIDEFIQKKGKSFPIAKHEELKQKFEQATDDKFEELMKTGFKSSGTMTVMALLFPGFGIDRFNTGSSGLGILRIVFFLIYIFLFIALSKYDDVAPLPTLLLPWSTFILFLVASVTFSVGGLGIIALAGGLVIFIWYAVELFTAARRTKNCNYKKLLRILAK
jgi:lipopolysaccharide export LptBFGC system permease protein LptF